MEEEKGYQVNMYVMSILLIGMFGGGALIYFMASYTFISIDKIVFSIILVGIVALGIHYLFLRKLKRFFIEVVAYSLLGWGSIVTGCALSLNYFIRSNEVDIKYPVSGNVEMIADFDVIRYRVKVEDKELSYFSHFLTFDTDELVQSEKQPNNYVEILKAKGIFGFDVLEKKFLHTEPLK